MSSESTVYLFPQHQQQQHTPIPIADNSVRWTTGQCGHGQRRFYYDTFKSELFQPAEQVSQVSRSRRGRMHGTVGWLVGWLVSEPFVPINCKSPHSSASGSKDSNENRVVGQDQDMVSPWGRRRTAWLLHSENLATGDRGSVFAIFQSD